MEAQLEQLDGDRARLTVEVPAGEVQHAVEHATHDLADRVKVPGFRPGTCPQQVLLSRIGKQRIYAEAIESHISSWFWSAARTNRLRPTEQPDYTYDLPTEERRGVAVHRRVRRATGRRARRLDEARGAEARGRGQRRGRRQQLAALQEIDASLAQVDGRPARFGDVAVVDIESDSGPGQRDYVVELGYGAPGRGARERDSRSRSRATPSRSTGRAATAARARRSSRLKELYEKVLPPLDDDFAHNASEFDTLDELRADIVEQIRTLLEREVENRFRADAVDELIKAIEVRPASLLIEMRTRDLINAFIRQLDAQRDRPGGLPARGRDQRRRSRAAASAPRPRTRSARELVLEGVADKLDIQVSDDDIRADLSEEGESEEDIEEFMSAGGADRVRAGLPAQASGRPDRRRGDADLAGARDRAREHLDARQGRGRRDGEEIVDTRQ